jgi:rfaE bifunctional protein nucleotidyltransferase chain/domain
MKDSNYTLSDVSQKLSLLHKAAHKVILISGTFDLLHVGHLRFINKAKEHGDIVVVLVYDDDTVKLKKGSKRPIVSDIHRAELISNLKYVNYVFISSRQADDEMVLNEIKPDVFVYGVDNEKIKNKADMDQLQNKYPNMKILILKSDLKGAVSTTEIIQKIRDSQ